MEYWLHDVTEEYLKRTLEAIDTSEAGHRETSAGGFHGPRGVFIAYHSIGAQLTLTSGTSIPLAFRCITWIWVFCLFVPFWKVAGE